MEETSQLPFLFIHGAGGTNSKWRLLRERLGNQSAAYIDLPGRGDNSGIGAATISEYSNFISGTITEETIIVGHSMGGLIGIDLAYKNPKVKGLVLVGSHFSLPVHPKILSSLREGDFPERLFYASYSKKISPELLEQERSEISLVEMKNTYIDFNTCNEYVDGKENFSKINIPVLAVYGDEDRMLPENAEKNLIETNQKAKTRNVGNAGHYIMVEQPDELASILLDFRDSFKD